MGDSCIPLTGSTACPAFENASISTDSTLIEKFSFLQYVSNVEEFDEEIESYVLNDYVRQKYQQRFGCSGIDLSNTSSLYGRYSTSVVCNGIVQESKAPCDLSDEESRPLCADACVEAARNEQRNVANPDICGNPNDDYMEVVRSNFAICSQPADSITVECVQGSENEPAECGFGPNLLGLCGYCAASSPNSTDSCCRNADAESRCSDVDLPSSPTPPPLFPSNTSTSSASPGDGDGGLSGGQIAGIVVGSVAGVALLGALVAFLIIFWRRRRRDDDTIFNQPSPQYRGSPTSREKSGGDYDMIRGGRVARMSALQSHQDNSPHATGAVGKVNDSSDSEPYGGTPGKSKRRPPVTTRRNGSLSSASVLAGEGEAMSPNSGSNGQYSSPEGVTSQSEQLPYFRDYYSEEDIHPNDKVAVLWAYQPRAGDEFELERGEMLKVVGIWDDGWATGVRLNDRAEDYDADRRQRDSGVSNGSERLGSSPPPTGEIKAFPLVCVCVPEHWKKTIEADAYDGVDPSSPPS